MNNQGVGWPQHLLSKGSPGLLLQWNILQRGSKRRTPLTMEEALKILQLNILQRGSERRTPHTTLASHIGRSLSQPIFGQTEAVTATKLVKCSHLCAIEVIWNPIKCWCNGLMGNKSQTLYSLITACSTKGLLQNSFKYREIPLIWNPALGEATSRKTKQKTKQEASLYWSPLATYHNRKNSVPQKINHQIIPRGPR